MFKLTRANLRNAIELSNHGSVVVIGKDGSIVTHRMTLAAMSEQGYYVKNPPLIFLSNGKALNGKTLQPVMIGPVLEALPAGGLEG